MMKKAIITIASVIVALIGGHAIGQNVLNYMEQGGARWVVGGSLDVASGGDLDIESGGAFKLAGTEVTATAAELNKLDGLTQVVPSTLATNAVGAANSIWGGTNQLIFEGTAATTAEAIITATNPATVDRTATFPDASGTVVLTGNITVSDSANQACDTTCGAATCIIGLDSGASTFIACDGATADSCICLSAE
jgi:hypothetical protein